MLLSACTGSGSDDAAPTPSPAAPTAGPTPEPSAAPDDLGAQALEEICLDERRPELFELPDPFHELVVSSEYDGRPWRLGRVPCERLEVLGVSEPRGARVTPGDSVPSICPFFRVRVDAGPAELAWVNACVAPEVVEELPPVTVEPLHPEGRPDMAFGTPTPTYREGDPCPTGFGSFSGWDVVVENRGDGTSSPTLRIVFDPSRGRGEDLTYDLVRGIEPGESIVIGHGENASTVDLDPRGDEPDADRSNNRLELGYTEVFIC
jgi:hypothetical protein